MSAFQIAKELFKNSMAGNTDSSIYEEIIKNLTIGVALKQSAFDHFWQNIIKNSIDTLAYIYNLLTQVIIATPSIIFNSTWFSDSFLKFAGISVIVFTLMALYNAGKKTFNLKHTKFSDVIRRYFLAITGIGFATFFFQQFFKVIKFISEVIVSIGYHEITALDFSSLSAVTFADTLALLLFNVVLIGLTAVILLQNGRRWFQLASIGLTASLSLSAWVFDGTRHIFSDIKEKFVKLSLTQVYHASMISMMGIFIVGTAGVNTIMDFVIKAIMIAGGFSCMAKPPEIMNRMIDRNTDDVLDMYKSFKKVVNYKLNPAYALGKKGFENAMNIKKKFKK